MSNEPKNRTLVRPRRMGKTTEAIDLLTTLLGTFFTKTRFGISTTVELIEVRRDRVLVAPIDGGPRYRVPIQEFLKFYAHNPNQGHAIAVE